MLKLQRLMLAGIIAASCSWSAAAEDLLQVYRQAEENDPILKAAVANREAAQEATPQARALSLPTVGATLEQGHAFGIEGAGPGPSSLDSHTYGVSLVQPLYNRSHHVRERLAEATVGQADVNLGNTRNSLALRVAEGYFGVLAALDNLTYAIAEKNAFARQLEQATRRFEVGLATITDVYDAQARFDIAVSQEIDGTNKLAAARELLRQLTGEDYAQLQVLTERMPLALPEPHDPDAWVRMALENNLALRSAGFEVDQARENIKLQKAAHYPTVDLRVSRFDTDNGINSNTASSQINLALTIPLYSGGAVSSRSREAAYKYEAARQTFENQQREIIRTVRNAYRGQETAISQIKAFDQTRTSTRSALEANQAGYEVGTRTIGDVLDAERNLYLAERNYANARYTYITNYLSLRQAAGQLAEVDMAEINRWLGTPRSTRGESALTPPPVVTTDSTKTKVAGEKKSVASDSGGDKKAAAQTTARAPTSPTVNPSDKASSEHSSKPRPKKRRAARDQ
ncbi:MAG: TolC family outer membrane protein [Candidatus Competibacter denitrificans]|jgi:outer membrane protein